jgi:uncharacterized protein YbjT (DUF2867 family)
MSKILTVFGATGSQGGSVVRTILNHPTLSLEYKIRGVTRTLTSDTSKALEGNAVEMIQARIIIQRLFVHILITFSRPI